MNLRDSADRPCRVLAAFAHPDDEAYGPCGALKAAAEAGAAVRLVIATRGEAGSLGISRDYTPAQLARIRQAEMQASARILGAELAILGYPDKGVEAVGPDVAVPALVREIRQFRPDLVMTFHPNGISGHSDHRAMSDYVHRAFSAAADPAYRPELGVPWSASRLYYYAVSVSRAAMLAERRRIHAVADEEVDLVLDVRHWLATKHRTCHAHATQLAFYQLLSQADGGIDAFWGTEHLVLGMEDASNTNQCSEKLYGRSNGSFAPH